MTVLLLLLAALGSDPTPISLEEGELALRRGTLEDAARACRAGLKGPEAARAHLLCAEVELASKRKAPARRHFEAATRAAEPGTPLRRRVLGRWKKANPKDPSPKKLLQLEPALRAWARRTPKGKAAAEKMRQTEGKLRALKDAPHAAWVRARRAAALAKTPNVAEALARPLTAGSQPSFVREAAWEALAQTALEQDALPEAVHALARAERIGEEGPATQPLRPSRSLERACSKLDAREGPGSCARVVAATGAFLVTDASRGAVLAQRPPEAMSDIHAEATLFLQDCLLTEARSDPSRYRGAHFELEWTIEEDGRATELDIRPRRWRPLADGCVGERLGWLRYPRVKAGVRETVSMSFDLH